MQKYLKKIQIDKKNIKSLKSNYVILLFTCVISHIYANPASSADFTVTSGSTVTTVQSLPDAGDQGTVQTGGTIRIPNFGPDNAVELQNADQTLTNDGTIETGAYFYDAVRSSGANGSITNNGSISTSGQGSHGIRISNLNQSVVNNGSLSTSNVDANGVYIVSSNADITNNGNISAYSSAIYNLGNNTKISNNGDIYTNNNYSTAIINYGHETTIQNKGNISVTGSGAKGVEEAGNRTTFVNTGKVSASGADSIAINITGLNTNFTNNGSISVEGANAEGINIQGTAAAGISITNNGSISTVGESSDTLVNFRKKTTIFNHGTLSAEGDRGTALLSHGDGSVVNNTGTITVSGTSASGFGLGGKQAVGTNSGTILATGMYSEGVDFNATSSSFSNSGTITASGVSSKGLLAQGSGSQITNSGFIRANGSQSSAVRITDDGISLTNSGTLIGKDGYAVLVESSYVTVTLTSSSVVEGKISFVYPTRNTLAVETDRTTILSIDGLPATISANGHDVFLSGNTLVVVDTDNFGLNTTGATLNALTREASGTVEDQLATGRSPQTTFVATHGAAPAASSPRISVWASPFGGILNRAGSDGYQHSFGGFMAGADREFAADLRAGLTGGFSLGHTKRDDDIHSANTYSILAGGYLAKTWQETFSDIVFLGGYLKSDDDVSILNSTVSGGVQDLTVNYDYLYLSPSLRLGRDIALGSATLTPSVRARYSGLWQIGEAKVTDNRFGSIQDRSLHILELRGQTSYAFAPITRDNGSLHLSVKAGIDGIFTLEDNVNGSLSGTTLNLSVDDDDAVIRGFATADAVWETNGGAKLFASLGGGYDSAETVSANLRFGARIPF